MTGLVWITGASSGIGRALALRLAADGREVVGSARSEDALRSLAQEATGRGTIHPLAVDVTAPAAVAAAVEVIERTIGPIGQAVLNAGTHKPIDPLLFRAADVASLVGLNLVGTANCLQAVLPPMLARGGGRIALVGSLAGYRGLPTSSGYGMTKAGLINMAEALRVELASSGIVVQVINPGFVRTPLTDRNPFPMPFLMEPEAAAAAIARGLASNRFEIAFPWRFALIMKLLRIAPAPLAFAVTRRMVPRR